MTKVIKPIKSSGVLTFCIRYQIVFEVCVSDNLSYSYFIVVQIVGLILAPRSKQNKLTMFPSLKNTRIVKKVGQPKSAFESCLQNLFLNQRNVRNFCDMKSINKG